MASPRTIQRHIETVATLDVIASGALLGFATWLHVGARAAVNAEEHALRLDLARAMFGASAWFLVVWAFVERRWVVARAMQFATGVLLMPIFPIGTAWGCYILWAITRSGAREVFGPQPFMKTRYKPYWGAVTLATIVGVTTLTFAAVRGRAAWLELQVESATDRASLQQATISHKVQSMRDHGILE